jgi:uncharacterized protein YdiU (UPF0061 family)
VAASHIRVGTFQFFAAREDVDALRILTTYALERHYPRAADRGNAALTLLGSVVEAQAELVARWLGVGFVHGVMNTDNTAISGETIDYGPCAFLDTFDPNRTFSSIDRGGRYAFANQPRIAFWNLARLAEALLPLCADDQSEAVRRATTELDRFAAIFGAAHAKVMRDKLGFATEREGDDELARDLLERLAANHVDYTLFFRRLCDAAADTSADREIAAQFDHAGAFHDWAQAWRGRLANEERAASARADAMRRVNPAFIPRNHLVEAMIEAAIVRGDYEPLEALSSALERPFDDQPEHAALAEPPGPEQDGYRTFCGT